MSDQKPQVSGLNKFFNTVQPFLIGLISGCTATCCIQPTDMVKVKIQLKNEEIASARHAGKHLSNESVSPIAVIKETFAKGGIKEFYKGLDAAVTRQVFYATTRLGVYKTLFDMTKHSKKRDLTMGEKSVCALTAGLIGAVIGNPADLALIRLQYDTTLPPEQKRGYKNVGDAFSRILKEEGALALWRGCTPTVARAMVINLVMLAPYDEIKERLNKYSGTKDTKQTRLIAAAIAGGLSAFFSLPFDNAKTKLQKMKPLADGTMPYKNIADAMIKTFSREGVQGLWVGLPTFYVRIAPHVMITLLVQDYITKAVNAWRGKH